jgi:hypothetical protein
MKLTYYSETQRQGGALNKGAIVPDYCLEYLSDGRVIYNGIIFKIKSRSWNSLFLIA